MRLTNGQCRRWLNRHYALPCRADRGVGAGNILRGSLRPSSIEPVLDREFGWTVRKEVVKLGNQHLIQVHPVTPSSPSALLRRLINSPHSWYLAGGVVTGTGLMLDPPQGWLWPTMVYGMVFLVLYVLQTTLLELDRLKDQSVKRMYAPSWSELRSIVQQDRVRRNRIEDGRES